MHVCDKKIFLKIRKKKTSYDTDLKDDFDS